MIQNMQSSNREKVMKNKEESGKYDWVKCLLRVIFTQRVDGGGLIRPSIFNDQVGKTRKRRRKIGNARFRSASENA